jgi:hypothetical protein
MTEASGIKGKHERSSGRAFKCSGKRPSKQTSSGSIQQASIEPTRNQVTIASKRAFTSGAVIKATND